MPAILTNKWVRAVVSLSIYALLFVFIGKYLGNLDFDKLSEIEFNWWFMVAALPFSILSRVFLPYIWTKLIGSYQKLDSSNQYWELNYVYAKAWLGKYIPGKVAWVAGKVYFALGLGISKTILGITSVVDTILQLLTALLLGVVFLFISGASSNFSTTYNVFFLVSSIVGLIAISPPVFNRLLQTGYKLLKKKKLEERYLLKAPALLRIAPMYFVIHSLSSLPIYFLIRSAGYELSPIDLMYVSGAFIFAGAVGTLAIFAPSGIGVREGIILLFLSNVLPAEVSVVIVVLLRLWSVVLDLTYWAMSYIIVKYRRGYSSSGKG